MKGSGIHCNPLIRDRLIIHECFLALFHERFIYEVISNTFMTNDQPGIKMCNSETTVNTSLCHGKSPKLETSLYYKS